MCTHVRANFLVNIDYIAALPVEVIAALPVCTTYLYKQSTKEHNNQRSSGESRRFIIHYPGTCKNI